MVSGGSRCQRFGQRRDREGALPGAGSTGEQERFDPGGQFLRGPDILVVGQPVPAQPPNQVGGEQVFDRDRMFGGEFAHCAAGRGQAGGGGGVAAFPAVDGGWAVDGEGEWGELFIGEGAAAFDGGEPVAGVAALAGAAEDGQGAQLGDGAGFAGGGGDDGRVGQDAGGGDVAGAGEQSGQGGRAVGSLLQREGLETAIH